MQRQMLVVDRVTQIPEHAVTRSARMVVSVWYLLVSVYRSHRIASHITSDHVRCQSIISNTSPNTSSCIGGDNA
jgi:hypothetical protein